MVLPLDLVQMQGRSYELPIIYGATIVNICLQFSSKRN